MAALTRIVLIVALLAALLPTGAEARHRHHRHRGGFDVGDAIVGAVILGGVLAVANAAKKDRRDRDERGRRGRDWPQGDWGQDWEPNDDYDRRGPYASEGAVVDACVREAEDLAGRYGAEADVIRVGEPEAQGAETRVSGLIEITDRRDGYDGDRTTNEWVCYVRADGRIASFRFMGA